MKKMRCLLVDDEPLAIALLKQHIAQIDWLEVSGDCPNAVKALEILRTKEIDLLFLDIRMPAIDGLGLLKMLRDPPRVIITTAYREYALEGYDLDIVDYLLKPITFDRFLKATERVLRQKVPPAEDRTAAPVSPGTPDLYLKSGYRNVRVPVDSILYMESLKDYVKVHTGTEVIVTRYKISEMEAQLRASDFLRIHRSYIINRKRVSAYTASQVEIGEIRLPIGESYKEWVIKMLRTS